MAVRVSALRDTPKWLRLLVYGDPGVGKTTLAASSSLKTLFISAEGGLQSIEHRGNCWYVDVDNMQELTEAYKEARSGNYQVIAVDSLSECARQSMDECLAKSRAKDSSRDQFQPELRDYSRLTEQMRYVIRLFFALPMHVVFTCPAFDDKDEGTGIVKTVPVLTPKVRAAADIYAETVGYLYVDREGVRNIKFHPERRLVCKDRTGKLPAELTIPEELRDQTLDEILSYITPEGKRQNNATQGQGKAAARRSTGGRSRS